MKLVAAFLLAITVLAAAGAATASGVHSARTCDAGHIGALPEPTVHNGRSIVDAIRVGGLSASCAGGTVEVVLTGTSGPLLRIRGVAPAGGGVLRLPTTRDVPANAVVGVSVAIRS